MPLQPQLKVISLSADQGSVSVKDITGTYSANNLGGYGAPNLDTPAIAWCLIGCTYFDLTKQSITSVAKSDLLGNGATVKATDLGLPSFKDGVYDFNYYVAFAGPSISFVGGSKNFSLPGANATFAVPVGFIIPSVSVSKVYLIDRLQPLSSAGGSVIEALPVISPTPVAPVAIQIVYGYNFKLLVKETGRQRLIRDISLWSFAGCPHRDQYDILKRYKYKLTMETQFAAGHYLDAHLAAQYLQG